MVKDASNLKVGKLTTVSKQKNANYHLPEEADLNAVHEFVENCCELFILREAKKNQNGNCGERIYFVTP